MEKPEVEIRNWFIEGGLLFGDAADHPHLGNQFIRSSTIQKFDREEGVVETRNTVYRLIGEGHADGERIGALS